MKRSSALIAAWLLAVAAVSSQAQAPAMRSMAFRAADAAEARAWRETLRAKLFTALKLDALRNAPESHAVSIVAAHTVEMGGVSLEEIAFHSTPGREIKVLVGRPPQGAGPFPAVVCLHGHGGTRATPFDGKNDIYKQFGVELMRHGFVVVAPDVGQHEVYEAGTTLMGERLWDCIRCVDVAASLSYVDATRIGCAGLSLGGEMSMWLGAMEPRVAAVSSCGFLTKMDQMEHNHCLCWKFDGLRELADFPDIYALIAPRPLQCQNGKKEPANQFPPALAAEALKEIELAYAALGAPDAVALHVHGGAHEIDLPAMLAFFEARLGKKGE